MEKHTTKSNETSTMVQQQHDQNCIKSFGGTSESYNKITRSDNMEE